VVTLRPYRSEDAPALLALFRDTIRRINSRDYSPAQIAAWASDDIDTVRWFGRFTGRYVPVAEEGGRPVGFAELESDGHIDRVYVSAEHHRRGIGRQLLAAVVAEARRAGLARLFTEASITARPFFEAQGFTVLAQQVVWCRGAEFVNYRMERVLADPAAGGRDPGSSSHLTTPHVRRLRAGDRDLARRLFGVLAEVFSEGAEPLSDGYLDDLLHRDTLWAMAAHVGDDIVGGLTAHQLPMTRAEAAELFVYDVAVRPDHQRQGIGRRLMTALLEAAAAAGVGSVFVPADTSDGHALDFYRALGGVPTPVTLFTFPAGVPKQ
jgi:ribosomal protein S18 acetylase RimI-like enzyme